MQTLKPAFAGSDKPDKTKAAVLTAALCAEVRGCGAVDFLIETPAPEGGDFDPMARLVMKFGGTSVATIERIRNIARHIARAGRRP